MYKTIMIFAVLFIVTCNGFDERIVGGSKAVEGEFPYQVSIRYRAEHDCGGAILDEYWILTAAHCLKNRLVQKMTVVTGSNYLDHGGDFYNVSKIIPHSGFSSFTRKDDIGLLKLKSPIKFGLKVHPIRLPSKDVETGDVLTLAGWGQINDDENVPNELQKIKLESISNFRCFLYLQPNVVWTTNLCTLNKKGEGACYGDSGGALTLNGEVTGIVSWSRPCAIGKPDVFTRVYDYLIWIDINKQN